MSACLHCDTIHSCGLHGLPPIPDNRILVSDVNELNQSIESANNSGNVTIAITAGNYELTTPLAVTGNNITIRSVSGNRNDVILTGGGMNPQGLWQIFMVYGDNCTIANITMGWVATHAIQIHGESDSDNLLVHNVHILDTYEQMIKGSWGNDDRKSAKDVIISSVHCLNILIRLNHSIILAALIPTWKKLDSP